jgi:uncharacterized repeat protein (TIGR01451 family)
MLALALGLVAVLGVSLVRPATAVAPTGLASGQGPVLRPSPPPPGSNLFPSHKFASKPFVGPGEQLTYTIQLYNMGMTDTVAEVTDRLPAQVNYIADSANEGGVFDPVAGTVSWSGVTVPQKSGVSLSFLVTMSTVSMPTIVVNTAVITSDGTSFERQAWVLLAPGGPVSGPNLSPSFKIPSRLTLAPGEVLTYTIWMYNIGTADAVAQVTDQLPAQVSYVDGSATGGGVYDPSAGTLAWSGVTVPVRSHVSLSYAVTVSAVTTPSVAMNTAVITAGNTTYVRHAWVLLLPGGPPTGPNLFPSFKHPSRFKLAPDETLTYTIRLRNVGTAEAVATVTDPLPTGLNYVDGSANTGGVYDPLAGTLLWSGVTVPVRSEVSLSFAVTTTGVTTPTVVTNTAVISDGVRTFERRAWVLLVPQPVPSDTIPPVVHSLTIDDQDVLTSPTVTLHISATDNVAVRWMYLREWQWARSPWPHWQVAHSSGWVPYQDSYAWTLKSEAGTHFVGVWVADAARNTSRLDNHALDYASLLQSGASLPPVGVTPYLVYYEAGEDVSAVLTPISGNSDLYVWYAGHWSAPIASAAQTVTFTTQYSGTYVFLVHGQAGATYDLSIAPGGGPRPPALGMTEAQIGGTSNMPIQGVSGGADDLISILTQSGLAPTDVADAPGASVVYLPLVVK